jgi:putative nucleotidyltransferase with HDIG domain
MDSPVKPVPLERLKAMLGSEIQTLPCLPPVLLGVQKAITEGDVGARELAHVILADPSLTARVLKLANSLYYAGNQKIRTVTQAILVMGFETVRNLVLGLSVYDMLSNLPKAMDYRTVWRHSLCCGVCSRYFAAKLRIPNPEQAFVAGLLHDLGKLVLGQFFPEAYAEVRRKVTEEKLTYHHAEMRVLGYTHEDVGRCVAEYWAFPEELAQVVSRHEASTPEEVTRMGTVMQRIVAAANESALFLYHEDTRARPLTSSDIQTLCQRGLGIGNDALLEIFAQIKAEVSQTARMLNIAIDEWKLGSVEPEEEPAKPTAGSDEARLEFLLLSSDLLAETHPIELYWKQTSDALSGILELQSLLLLVRDPNAAVLKVRLSSGAGVTGGTAEVAIPFNAPDDVAAAVFLQKKAIALKDENLLQYSRPDANIAGALGTYRLAAVPVHLSDGIAVLVAARPASANALNAGELRLLSAFARDLAQAFEVEPA